MELFNIWFILPHNEDYLIEKNPPRWRKHRYFSIILAGRMMGEIMVVTSDVVAVPN